MKPCIAVFLFSPHRKEESENERRFLRWNWRCGWLHCFPFWWVGCRPDYPCDFYGCRLLTGLIVAGVFHNSNKTENGSLESLAGWKGLCRKGVTLLIVLVGCRLDLVMGSNFIRDAVVIAFIANETISIVENAGLMGVPIPSVIVKAIEVLKKKAESEDKENE